MLSFLRDSGFDDLPAEKNASSGTGSQGGSSGGDGQDFVAVSTSSDRVRRSTALVAILLGVGLVCIWVMVKKTTPQSAAAAPGDANTAEIERAIVHITGAKTEIFGKMDDLVGKFNEFSEVPQVEVEELVKDPFELEAVAVSPSSGTEQVVIDHLAIRRKKAQKQADGFNLLTIMASEGKNSCMIDNRFLSVGSRVGDFTISAIESNSVELLWNPDSKAVDSIDASEKVEITLKLTE